MHSTSPVNTKLFALFCLASFLLSLSYGSTFLLSLLIQLRGGNEHDAGSVISTAMLSTFVAVVVSGHLADAWGAARAIAGTSANTNAVELLASDADLPTVISKISELITAQRR